VVCAGCPAATVAVALFRRWESRDQGRQTDVIAVDLDNSEQICRDFQLQSTTCSGQLLQQYSNVRRLYTPRLLISPTLSVKNALAKKFTEAMGREW